MAPCHCSFARDILVPAKLGLKRASCAAEGLPRQDFTALHPELLGYAGYARRGVPSVLARELSEEAVRHSALSQPLLVTASPAAVSELGLVLPPEPLTPDRVASQLGASYEVGVAAGHCAVVSLWVY